MTQILFVSLVFVIGALAIGWLTRPLWRQGAQFLDTAVASVLQPRRSLGLSSAIALFVAMIVLIGYALVGAPENLGVAPVAAAISPAKDVNAAASLVQTSVSQTDITPTNVTQTNVLQSNASPSSQKNITQAKANAASQRPPAREDSASVAGGSALQQAESRVYAMVDSLAERLKTRPDDAEGWKLLGRSYASLGRHSQAVSAFKTALRLKPDDSALLTDYAFSTAVLDPHGGKGEPAKLIAKALQLDPNNRKALALAGTLALDRKDYQGAVQYWEQLVKLEPADSLVARQVQVSIVQARQLAGTQPTLTPSFAGGGASASLLSASSSSSPVSGSQVGGIVSLAPSLIDRASPEDTVFIYARSAGGPRMPLAVLKKQVKDLPLRFTLDDTLAMSPNSKLSSAMNVVVGARISKGGNAVASSGDLQGQLAAVPLGSIDLKIQINEVVGLR